MVQILLLASSARAEYREAVKRLEERDLRGAANAAQRSLSADPSFAPAISLMARIEMASGDLDAASKRLRSGLAAHEGDASIRFLLGFCLYLQNDFEAALETFAPADSSDARVILYRALSNEALGRRETAVSLYLQAIGMSKSAEPRLALARLLRKEGDIGGSARLIDEALANEPESREALYEKGQELLASGNAAQAAQFGERALAAGGDAPSEREIRYLLIRAYLKSGDSANAARHRAAFEKLPQPLVR